MSKSARQISKRSKEPSATWYTVRLLLRAEGKDQPKKRPPYEDRWLVVEASDPTTAERKAIRFASDSEVRYKNMNSQWVKWRVVKVVAILELLDAPLVDGSEVYWRFFYSGNATRRLKREGMV
jgi:hypothetical protein